MTFFRAFLLISMIWAGLFLPGLGEAELKGEEGRRILPAREMLRRDDFVLPYSEGRPYHRKPPGINWAIASSFTVTGIQNEFSARLPSVLALLALALTGLWAGRQINGLPTGIALGLSLIMNAGMIEKARLAEIESVYVSMAGIGMLLWAAAWAKNRSVWWIWFATIIPFAVANLTKGPVYLLFFYPIVFVALKRTGKLKSLLHPAHLISLLLALAPMIYWGWLVKQRMAGMPVQPVMDDDGNEVLARTAEDVWWQQVAGRLMFDNINWGDWAQLPVRVLILMAPWPVIAILLWWRGRKQQNPSVPSLSERAEILRSALGWGCLVSIAAFCLLPATRSRYLMPALAPVCAWSVLTIFKHGVSMTSGRVWRGILLLLLSAATLGGISLPWILKMDSPVAAMVLNMAGTAALWIVWRALDKQPVPLRYFWLMAPPLLLAILVVTTTVLPVAKLHENVRSVAQEINTLTPEPGSIVAVNPGPQPFLFYLGTRAIEVVKISEYPDDTAYVLIPPREWSRPEYRERLESRGFTEILTKVKDLRVENGREFFLVGKVKNTQ